MKIDFTKRCNFAIIDVETMKANKEIAAMIKRGSRVQFTLEGVLDEQPWSRFDGTSIEQSSSNIISLKIAEVKPHPHRLVKAAKQAAKLAAKHLVTFKV